MPSYHLAFDSLGSPHLVLAGIARHATSKGNAQNLVLDHWRCTMADRQLRCRDLAPDAWATADLLGRAGFDGAVLSLFWRSATADEV